MTLTSKCSEIKKLLEGSFVIRLADDYLLYRGCWIEFEPQIVPATIGRVPQSTSLNAGCTHPDIGFNHFGFRRPVLFKGAMAGLAFSSPRPGRTATISLALVAGAGVYICGGTFERIPL